MAGVRAAIPAHRLARQPFAPADGAGPTIQLDRPNANAAYCPRQAELTGLLSVGVRLTPWHRYETTLGLRVHVPLTTSYAYCYPDGCTNQRVYVMHEIRRDEFARWFGFTLGITTYPAASKGL